MKVLFAESGVYTCVVFKVTTNYICIREKLSSPGTWHENIHVRDWEGGRFVSVVERKKKVEGCGARQGGHQAHTCGKVIVGGARVVSVVERTGRGRQHLSLHGALHNRTVSCFHDNCNGKPAACTHCKHSSSVRCDNPRAIRPGKGSIRCEKHQQEWWRRHS